MEARIAKLRRQRVGKRPSKARKSTEGEKRQKAKSKPKFQDISLSAPPKPSFTLTAPFVSVLSQPFSKWNELERVIGEFAPELNHLYRSYITMHLVRFLELKIMIEEFSNHQLLSPTRLIARAWQALILSPNLYMEVAYDIQDFHNRPRHALSHDLMKQIHRETYVMRLERTQRLFHFHYNEAMPVTLDDIELDLSMKTDDSGLTDIVAAKAWFMSTPPCAVVKERSPDKRRNEKTTLTPPRVEKENSKFGVPRMSRWMCWDAMKDALNFKDEEESSLECTEIIDDIEELSANFIVETEENNYLIPGKQRKSSGFWGENSFLRRFIPPLGAFYR